jgi:hypothetical protein
MRRERGVFFLIIGNGAYLVVELQTILPQLSVVSAALQLI